MTGAERVFSYGTLQFPQVQQALYGGPVPTVADALPGYVIGEIVITDADVIAKSGTDRHPILRPGSATDSVTGSWLELTPEQLVATDDYEVDDYTRVECTLASGVTAWAYVAAE